MKRELIHLRQRAGRTILSVLCFLLLFLMLLSMMSHFYIIPSLDAAKHMDHAQRRKLAADALLLMVLMLTLLMIGLLITFRISRFFFPRPTSPRSRTKVVDAWAEAGKRMEKGDEKVDEGESGGE